MRTLYDDIMEDADRHYACEKTKHLPEKDLLYMPPEAFPRIQSDQVKCLAKAIAGILSDMLQDKETPNGEV